MLRDISTLLHIPIFVYKSVYKLFVFILIAKLFSSLQKTVKPSPILPLSSSASLSATPKDEIYIDDESIEGSGGRGGVSCANN